MAETNPTIVCVLRSGGIYTPEWVLRLARGFERHTSVPYRFVCLSDMEIPSVEVVPLEQGWPGWWSKIELFRPGLFDGTVFYLDLDSIVVGDPARILQHRHAFTMTHEFNRPNNKQWASCAMAWIGDFSHIHAEFLRDPETPMKKYRRMCKIGDQAFIEDQLQANGTTPDSFRDLFGERTIASYKRHRCFDAPPPDAVAVTFHGLPKMHQTDSAWVKEEMSK